MGKENLRTAQVVILGVLGSSEMPGPESPAAPGLDGWEPGPACRWRAGCWARRQIPQGKGKGHRTWEEERDSELGRQRTREIRKQISRDEERKVQSWRDRDVEMGDRDTRGSELERQRCRDRDRDMRGGEGRPPRCSGSRVAAECCTQTEGDDSKPSGWCQDTKAWVLGCWIRK